MHLEEKTLSSETIYEGYTSKKLPERQQRRKTKDVKREGLILYQFKRGPSLTIGRHSTVTSTRVSTGQRTETCSICTI